MNKVILGLLLAVCVLGMALIMLNERLGRKNEPGTLTTLESSVTEHRGTVLPDPAPGRAQPQGADALPAAPAVSAPEQQAPPAPRLDMPREAAGVQETPAMPARGEAAPRDAASLPPDTPVTAKPDQPAVAQTPAPQRSAAQTPALPKAPPQNRDRAASDAPRKAQPKQAAAEPEITKTVVFARDNGATVRLSGNGPIRYKSMLLENPSRLVVDLDGQWQIKAPGVPKNPIVSNVRIGKLEDKTRIVIDLKAAPRQSRVILSKDRNSIDVRIDK